MPAKRAVRVLVALLALVLAGAVGVPSASAKTIRGTAKNDVLKGTLVADIIYGLGGNDKISGLGGNDRLYGGPGADTIACGAGKDTVFADRKDTVAKDCEIVKGLPVTPPPPFPKSMCMGREATIVGSFSINGTQGDDVIVAEGFGDSISAGAGNDFICGTSGNDRIDGGEGTDTIESGTGVDICISGEAGENCSAAPNVVVMTPLTTDEQSAVLNELTLAQRTLRETVGVALDGFTFHIVATSPIGQLGTAVSGLMAIFIRDPFWTSPHGQSMPWMRAETIAHEFFHMVQDALSRGLAWGAPAWIFEGSAEWFAYFSIDHTGIHPFSAAWRMKLDGAKAYDWNTPLQSCGLGSYCPYQLGFLAIDRLVQISGFPAFIRFLSAMSPGTFPNAFQEIFGRSVDQFYAEFEAYRQTL